MAVSPADFELYSRVTGTPIPRDPQERMRMAPEVYNFSRDFAREPSGFRKAAGALGRAAQLGGALAGAYGIAKALGPEAGEIVSQVANEVVKENKGPSEVVITDLRTPKESHIRKGNYSGNKSGNYGKELPKRDLIAEAEEKAAKIIGGQLATREGGGQIEDPWDDGNTRPYDRFEGAGLATKGRTDTRGGLRKFGEDKLANYPAERDMLVGGTVATAGAVGKNVADAANIVAGGDPMGNPVTNTVTQAMGGAKEALLQKIPPYHALTETVQGGVETAQNAYEAIRGLGFAPGANVGTVLDWAGTQASNFPGAATVSEIGGNVLEAMGQVATNMPIEAFFGITGAVGGATAMGVARGLNKIGKSGNTVIDQASQAINKAQKVINSVKTDHAQIDSPGQDQKRIAPNKTIHTGGSIQGSEPGLGAQVDSGSPQTNRRREELRETFRKSLGTVPPEKREALIDQQLEKESNSKGLSQLKNFVSKAMSSDIAQAGDQAAKKVVRGVLRTVAGEEKFQEMAAENLREQQAERMRSMAGNEARMANVRSKYSMDYNPAAPKLAGDAIIGLNKDRFGSSAYIPTGGIDMLRDESLPASAYDVRVPREDEETPLMWEV